MTAVDQIRIRVAVPADIPKLRELIDASVRGLQSGFYTQAQIDGGLASVYGVDTQLIADGTYFIAEALASNGSGAVEDVAGCGGWSKRKTLYGGDRWTAREDTLLDPKCDAAKIRAFFIHPAWARRGVGSKILEACEAAAREAGFRRYEMGATLTGAKLFGAKGYVALEKIEVPLKNGLSLSVIHMTKRA